MTNLRTFIIFLALVLLIYGSANYYVYKRIMQTAALFGASRVLLKYLLVVVILAFPIGEALGGERFIGRILIWVGSFWLAALTYGLLLALAIDMARMLDLLTGWFPVWITGDRVLAGRVILGISTLLIVTLLIGGHINSKQLVTRELTLEIGDLSPDLEGYHIAVFADIHLGTLIGKQRLKQIVRQVTQLNADMILIVGDLIDEPPRKLKWVVDILSNLDAPDGVWAVSGNHEFYSGIEESAAMLNQAGIRLLRDEAVTVDGKLVLAGLDDATGRRGSRGKTRSLSDILGETPENLPIVLMHHTPTRIDEAAAGGVNLMLSGHTHNGQLWPIGYLTRLIYGVRIGYSTSGDMHFYLTSGVGTWGPPVRVLTRSEILSIKLKPTSEASDINL